MASTPTLAVPCAATHCLQDALKQRQQQLQPQQQQQHKQKQAVKASSSQVKLLQLQQDSGGPTEQQLLLALQQRQLVQQELAGAKLQGLSSDGSTTTDAADAGCGASSPLPVEHPSLPPPCVQLRAMFVGWTTDQMRQ